MGLDSDSEREGEERKVNRGGAVEGDDGAEGGRIIALSPSAIAEMRE